MALNSPQADLPIRLRGGADVWDEGAAGLILSSEFFVESSVGTIYNVGCSELTDAADESTTLMLALLNEYAATTAIDLPAGQYTVINDADEAVSGNDEVTSTAVALAASAENGTSDTSQSSVGPVVVTGAANATGDWVTAVTTSMGLTGSAVVASADTPAASAAFVASDTAAAAGIDGLVGTYATNSAGSESSPADAAQAVDSATYVDGQALGSSDSSQTSTYSTNTTLSEAAPAVGQGAGAWVTQANTPEPCSATEVEVGSAQLIVSGWDAATPNASQNIAISTNSTGSADVLSDASSAATALFVVTDDEFGTANESNNGSATQFADLSEALAALEMLVVEVFGPSALTPELSRVLIEVAKSYMLRDFARVDVLIDAIDSKVEKVGHTSEVLI